MITVDLTTKFPKLCDCQINQLSSYISSMKQPPRTLKNYSLMFLTSSYMFSSEKYFNRLYKRETVKIQMTINTARNARSVPIAYLGVISVGVKKNQSSTELWHVQIIITIMLQQIIFLYTFSFVILNSSGSNSVRALSRWKIITDTRANKIYQKLRHMSAMTLTKL